MFCVWLNNNLRSFTHELDEFIIYEEEIKKYTEQ